MSSARRPRPTRVDVGLAVGLTVVAVLLGQEQGGDWRPLDLPGVLLIAGGTLPVAFRRSAPVLVLVCCASAWIGWIAAGYWPALNVYGTWLAVFTVAAQRPLWMAASAAAGAAAIWVYAGFRTDGSSMGSVLAQAAVFSAVAWKLGDTAQTLERNNHRLAALTERLRHEQEDRARRAVVDERVRIAQELHDIVAHHMAVVSVQAGMARYVFDTDPEAARAGLAVVADNSREAQEELRRMLGLLRTSADDASGDPDRSPAPGVARLDELAERVRAAGVPTELVVTGPARPLPPGLDACLYRVVQESLTNVLKHAGPASVTVALAYGDRHVTVTVTDNGRGPVPAADPGPGHGLIGMAERAHLYGGTLTAGPHAGGGFEVVLRLPLSRSTDP
ncbi:sensor histidine kinase [Asanoa sp. WMMD1127]|uniref:sensor histidine kinase n=1 Tax=Asanoa sp. WMMD1127 TaxID=3016107 RepID=UPI002416FD7F|nr:sensor histidine kinase [Asanoa sp. WMMD1127]MDG4821685.1 sensor histidine kinase [Asanoa sp. WMMD1127]